MWKYLFNYSVCIVRGTAAAVMLVTLLPGCLTPRNLDRAVTDHYIGEFPAKPKKLVEDITISSPLAGSGMVASQSSKKMSHLVPLLFYWSWNLQHICTVNPSIPVNNFSKTVLAQANKGLRQKLNGQTLELSVDSIPSNFVIDDDAHLVWVVYAFAWDKVNIVPDKTDLVVSYKLKQAGSQMKQGLIRIPGNAAATGIGMFESWRKATVSYLDDYNQRITAMSKLFVNKLLLEL